MIQRIIKDLSVFLAVSLWAVMLYLQAPIMLGCKLSFIYPSLEDFNNDFLLLSPELQNNVKKMLLYDNYFVLFFGLFLITYIITLKSILETPKRTEKINPITKKRLKIFLNVFLIFSIVYVVSDWTENWLLHRLIINEEKVIFTFFQALQILKWSLGAFVLVSCLVIDKTFFKNNLNIFWRVIICGAIMAIIIVFLWISDTCFSN